MVHNIVFIDNRDEVLKSQVLKLTKLLNACPVVHNDPNDHSLFVCDDINMAIKIYPLHIVLNKSIADGNKFKKTINADDLEKALVPIRVIYAKNEPTLFVVDLCLDTPQDSEIETGLKVAEKILAETGNKNKFDVLYTTGNASYWNPTKSGINSLDYAPRALTQTGGFDDLYRSEVMNPLGLWGDKLDDNNELYKMVENLIDDPTVNSQYMGTILKKCLMLSET